MCENSKIFIIDFRFFYYPGRNQNIKDGLETRNWVAKMYTVFRARKLPEKSS